MDRLISRSSELKAIHHRHIVVEDKYKFKSLSRIILLRSYSGVDPELLEKTVNAMIYVGKRLSLRRDLRAFFLFDFLLFPPMSDSSHGEASELSVLHFLPQRSVADSDNQDPGSFFDFFFCDLKILWSDIVF